MKTNDLLFRMTMLIALLPAIVFAQFPDWSLGLNSSINGINASPAIGFKDPTSIHFVTDSLVRAVISGDNGNLGLNTFKPQERLHINSGNVLLEGSNGFSPNIYWTHDIGLNAPFFMQFGAEYLAPSSTNVGGINFWKPWLSDDGTGGNGYKNYVLYLRNDGRVSIGSSCVPSDALFGVAGKMYAREIEVNIANWCDSVFAPNYKLLSFEELREFIKQNQHLPGIKSEKEVLESKSVNLMEMNLELLRKVEELHLYVLKLEEKIKAQHSAKE